MSGAKTGVRLVGDGGVEVGSRDSLRSMGYTAAGDGYKLFRHQGNIDVFIEGIFKSNDESFYH